MTNPLITSAGDGLAFEDGADRGRVIVFGHETGGAYALMEYVAAPSPPGATFGAHLHGACEETFLIQEGSLEFLIGKETVTLSPGDFVRVPAGVRHGYRNISGAEVRMLVGFSPGGLEELFVKYRTDQPAERAPGEGFVAEATRRFNSRFGLD